MMFFTVDAGVFGDLPTKMLDWAVGLVTVVADFGEKICTAVQYANIFSTPGGVNGVVGGSGEINSTFSAAGTTLMALLIAIEICQQAMGFHFEDFNEAARFLFKVVIYKVFVENSSKIASGVIGLFSDSFGAVGGKFALVKDDITALEVTTDSVNSAEEGFLGLNKVILAAGVAIMSIMLLFIIIKIAMEMAGILFEIGIHVAVAPIAVATLVNHETRSLGIGYIKSLAGTCVTIGVYGLCFKIYGIIYDKLSTSSIVESLTNNFGHFQTGATFIVPIICLFLLDVAIKNASSVVQRALG